MSSQSPDQQQAARDEAADQHGRNQGWLEEEAALQEALEASKVTAPGAQRAECFCMLSLHEGCTRLHRSSWLTSALIATRADMSFPRCAAGSTRSSVAQGTSTPGRPSSAHRSASEQVGV